MSLNFAQKNAVQFIDGPCLILAGAGSGKTKVIINKIIHLIKNCKYRSNSVVALTFTNKAAHEMRIRLAKHLDIIELRKVFISTFHSLGLKIIKQEIDSLKITNNFTIFDEKDQLILLKKISTKEIKNDLFLLKKINKKISYWKNKFLTPLQVKLSAQSSQQKIFAYIYQEYNNHLSELNILDFDDLICIPVTLLKNNTKIQYRWQEKISYLLVDEYQDTNTSQYELIKILTQNNNNFTLVGDDDQSIYSWRGANPKNITLLSQDFPTLKIIKMEHNYRSFGRILKVANSLIAHNVHYLKKKLFSKLEYGSTIEVIIGKDEEEEAEKIAEKIISQNLIKKQKYQDYAILYRGNYQARILEKILLKKNIPYSISTNSSFFSRVEIKDILSYLRIIINLNDNYAFMRVVNTPYRRIGKITLNKLEVFAKKNNKSFFQAIQNQNTFDFLKDKSFHKVNDFISLIQNLSKLSQLKPHKIVDIIINAIEYKTWLSKILKDPKKIQNSLDNINTLSKWIKNMIKGDEFDDPMTLSEIVNKMSLHDILDKKIKKNIEEKVQLMTLHSSKGLEFSSVFIMGMCEGILPNQKSINADQIEEERRLTYVGMTRAKRQLFLTYCKKRVEYGQILNTLPSRFLFELPPEDLFWQENVVLKKSLKINKETELYISNLRKQLKNSK